MFESETIKRVNEAEEQHQIISRRCVHKADGSFEITKEHDVVAYIGRLLKTVKKIAESTESMSAWEKGMGRMVPKFSRLGRDLEQACRHYREYMLVEQNLERVPRYQGHRFCPHLDVGLKAISDVEAVVEQAIRSHNFDLLHQTIGGLAETIRQRCNTPEFKTEVRNYDRNAKGKFKRALQYLLCLFRKRSRLLVLRVDLYVRARDKLWSYSPEADAAYDRFLEALTDGRIIPDVVGWMGAREDGLERGQHYHLLVAVDGHLHQAGAHLAKQLGDYWKDKCIPEGKIGSYFNCFGLEKRYRYLGIGMVHRNDAYKLLGLYYATRYLCKEEVQLIAVGDRKRNFRRGIIRRDHPRRGAPRLSGDGLEIAKKIFCSDWEIETRAQIKPA